MRNLLVEVLVSILLIYFSLLMLYRYTENSKEILIPKEWIKSHLKFIGLMVATNLVILIFFTAVYSDYGLMNHLRLISLIDSMFPMAYIDNEKQIIPNVFLIGALSIRGILLIPELILSPVNTVSLVGSSLLGAAIIGGFFMVLKLVFKGSIGMGDIKLFIVMGLYQGLSGALSSVTCSLFVAFFYALWLLITKRKKRKDSFSFAPMILIGTAISIIMTGI